MILYILFENFKMKYFQGAGDAFVGALAKYLVFNKDQPFHQIVSAACEVASISVTKEGTQTSYPQEHSAFAKTYPYFVLQKYKQKNKMTLINVFNFKE